MGLVGAIIDVKFLGRRRSHFRPGSIQVVTMSL